MILVGQSDQEWQYFLNPHEADVLISLVKKFPFTDVAPGQLSMTTSDPKTAEREKLLNESLAEHRQELTKLALNLLGKEKWKKSENGSLLILTSHSREILLQILNDIRVGCWRALGKPGVLEKTATSTAAQGQVCRQFMDLAGYFEANLLETQGS